MSAAEDLAALLVQLATDLGDARAALVEQGQAAENAPTSELGDLIRAINPSPPVNLTPPVLTGVTAAGSTLMASTGTWAGVSPISYAYQWYLDDVLVGGATTSSYATDEEDDGLEVFCRVTATNSAGSASEDSNTVTLAEAGDFDDVHADTTALTADTTTLTADHEAA
jgi:hypothetical protein